MYGGWEGHQPATVSAYLAAQLKEVGFDVTRTPSLDVLDDVDTLFDFNLIIIHWTRGELSPERFDNISAAVAHGVGLAGIHGGLTSAFQNNKKWLWLTGGCFVAHPGGLNTTYTVKILDHQHPITQHLDDFEIQTEQYFVLMDPAIHVLADTVFAAGEHPEATNPEPIHLPVAWIKRWGRGRVFFQSLGHDLTTCQRPEVTRLTLQGFQWAAQ
ncbi:hypothetical protein BVJ53_00630 [Lacticaseibacillus chiayiensis]|uniref:ThuA-like domain-containing protein n=1 Tax=Lacticaseibacillus chiayiensis TaxID=2100821 RepID=A0A4Q1UG69_9LACO|nr:ThuA domain-containing protein [Lacticaseibacillus chiayiensis]RXT30751.1 hypothetical protein BVJ53_00630 [Lacticaseibacillus chiayiensis]